MTLFNVTRAAIVGDNADKNIKEAFKKFAIIAQNKKSFQKRLERANIAKKYLLHPATRDSYLNKLAAYQLNDGQTVDPDYWTKLEAEAKANK